MKSSHNFPDPEVCKVKHIAKELYECLTDDAQLCPLAFTFGNGFYCKYPDCYQLDHESDKEPD
jgi:hypothetical protein